MNNTKGDSKKGQIQLGESIGVIVVVIILLFVGVVFWNKVTSSDIQDLSSKENELNVIEIANFVSEMPELKCSDSGVNKVKCLDWHKILAMNETINERENYLFYNNYFRNSKVTIRQIYPQEKNITIYDAGVANYSRSLLIPIPVNIKNYATKQTGYGQIIVEGYYK